MNYIVEINIQIEMSSDNDFDQDLGEQDIEIEPYDYKVKLRRQSSLDQYNSDNYDHSIHRSINQKRLSMSFFSCPIYKPQSIEGKSTFNHFLIIGCPPQNDFANFKDFDQSSPTPEILFIYPSAPLIFSSQEFSTLTHFCFPKGLKKVNDTKNKRVFISQFAFRLTASACGDTVFGVCTHINVAPFERIFFADERSKQYVFCFCFLTTNPMFSSIFQYSTFLALWITFNFKYVPHPGAYDKFTPPTLEMTKVFLPGLEFAAGSQRSKSIRIPRSFLQELTWFRTLQPNLQEPQHLTLSSKLHIVVPKLLPYQNYILYPCLDSLFSFLSCDNIVTLFTNLLLEVQTVFVSSNIHSLSLSIIAAVTLLTPFSHNGTIMPIVPSEPQFSALLDSPVPYVCGKLIDRDEEFIAPTHVFVVDLDHDQVYEQDKIPELPRSKELKQKLKDIIKEHETQISVPPQVIKQGVLKKQTKINDKYIEFVKTIGDYVCPRAIINLRYQRYVFTVEVANKIINCFMNAIAPTVESLIKLCFVTETTDISNPVTIFNKDLFLLSVPENDRPFFTAFVNTTMFQDFTDTEADVKSQQIANEIKIQRPKKKIIKKAASLNPKLERLPFLNDPPTPSILKPKE